MSIIERKFIQHVLKEEGARFLRNQGREIRKQLVFHTKRLINERTFQVNENGGMSATLEITHPSYQRFLDIRRDTVRKRKGAGRRKSRKGYRIHNRFVMGHYYAIAFRVQNDLTDEVRLNIKRQWLKGGAGNG
ncbi:MAG TPA: hypothetical protein VNQ80_12220 [Parapedobacter sp.]|uniref:hypothetical protein n=1 Tax=Parapedobacter sp. TaxID=1958893 RepID=UPI002BA96082|nr:hypothetical protein [Parapedobacter sp.]HWK58102.1 hypothetical protein [Parapedobacter sp.]